MRSLAMAAMSAATLALGQDLLKDSPASHWRELDMGGQSGLPGAGRFALGAKAQVSVGIARTATFAARPFFWRLQWMS